jgi:hypothetical protein
MKAILLAAVLMLNGLPQTVQSPVKNEQEHGKKEAKPPDKTPSFVTEPTSPVTAPVSQPTPNPQASDAKEKAGSWPPWTDIFWPTWILVFVTALAVAAALKTLGAINAQVEEMKGTGVQTDKLITESIAQSKSLLEQSQSLAKSAYHLGESAAGAHRSARAMEEVGNHIAKSVEAARDSVTALRERTAQQMRAYITVNIGGAMYQERQRNVRFEGKPMLINTGHTPARNISSRANAAIVTMPLPEDFAFPIIDPIKSSATVGSGQTAILSGIVPDYVDDGEVEDIKIGKNNRCLVVWGTVTYEDIFGESHFTNFCQTLFWQPDGKIYGFYFHRHNEAN